MSEVEGIEGVDAVAKEEEERWRARSAIAEVGSRSRKRVYSLRVLAQGIQLPSVRRERHAANAMRPQALESADRLLVALDESRVHATRVRAAKVPDFDGAVEKRKLERWSADYKR